MSRRIESLLQSLNLNYCMSCLRDTFSSACDTLNSSIFFIPFRYACLLDWRLKDSSVAGVIGYLSSLIWCPPLLAVFFAYFPPEERPDSKDILFLICCPSHLRRQVTKELQEKNINSQSEANSKKKMIPGHDKAYVSLSRGIRALEEDDVHLR